mgnify:CR=1 FL=1
MYLYPQTKLAHIKLGKMKQLGIILFACFGLMSCMLFEGKYEIISNSELEHAGIESPFPDFTFERDKTGKIIVNNDILREEGYSIETTEWLNTVIDFNKRNIRLNRLINTFLTDEYIIFKDGVNNITDDGLIKPFIYPKHNRLNLFKRNTFELIDQRVIFGRVLNVKIIDDFVYFVAEKDGIRFNARFKIPE